MAKFIFVSSAISKIQTRINLDQVLYIERKHVQEGYNREMTKIVFRDNVSMYVEDSMERLDKKLNVEI